MSPSPDADWERALRAIERHVDACKRALDRGATPPDPLPRGDLPPLPPHFAGRAQAALEAAREVEDRLQGELDRITAELRRLPRTRVETAAPPAFEVSA